MGNGTERELSGRLKIGLTAGNYAAFFCLGLLLSMLGPTLLDLAEILHAPISTMAFVFTARSLGYLLGSVVGGLVFDRTAYSVTLIGLAVLLASCSAFLVPIMPTVAALASVVSFQGLCMGFLDTGGNVLLVRCWHEGCGPYLQGLHFCFGLGAFIAPLLAKQYIANSQHFEPTNCTSSALPSTTPLLTSTTTTTSATLTLSAASVPPTTVPDQGFESQVDVAYRIVAGILLPTSLALLLLARFTPRDIMSNKGASSSSSSPPSPMGGAAGAPRSRTYVFGMLAAAFLFFMLYVGTEVSFGGYLYSHTVKSCDLQFSQHDGALITSVFWGMFSVGRFIAIPLSTRISPRTMVIKDLIGSLTAAVLMFALKHNPTVLWLGAGLFGLSMASVFPSGYHYVETCMSLSNAATSLLVVGSALGEMLIPLLVGTLFDHRGPDSLLTVTLASIAAATAVFLFILLWARRHVGTAAVSASGQGVYSVLKNSAFAIADSSDDSDGDLELPPLAAASSAIGFTSDEDDDGDDEEKDKGGLFATGTGNRKASRDEVVYDFASGEIRRNLL